MVLGKVGPSTAVAADAVARTVNLMVQQATYKAPTSLSGCQCVWKPSESSHSTFVVLTNALTNECTEKPFLTVVGH